MENRLAVIGVIAACAWGVMMRPALAYDEKTTHPALTDEMVSLYNRIYPEDAVSDQQRAAMIRGSKEEDIVPRPLNHLYDPVHGRGWSGQHAGWAPALVTRVVSLLALLPEEPVASVQWLNADALQQSYSRYGGNRSWPAALRAEAAGDENNAYVALGSALHLLEDAGVPEHARDDTHAHQVEFLTGDSGSPYEEYARRYGVGSLDIAATMLARPQDVPHYDDPAGYLQENAAFVANSFFSKDTVQSGNFPKPLVAYERKGVAFGKSVDGSDVQLALRVARTEPFAGTTSSLVIGDGAAFGPLLESQFRVIAPKTVMLGVGMIRDFRQAARQAGKAPNAKNQIFSPAGEISRFVDTASSWINEAGSAFASRASRMVAWLSGSNARSKAQENQSGDTTSELHAVASEIELVGGSQKAAPPSKAKVAAGTASVKPSEAAQSTFASCPSGGLPGIVINEVAWMGTSMSANDEWLELANRENEAVVLEGWELGSSDGSMYVDLDGVTIPAHGFALLERTDDASVPGIAAKALYTGGMPNAPSQGYALELQAPGCGIVDRAAADQGWPAGEAATRRTMERTGPGGWQTSALPGGTPGRANSAGLVKATTSTEERVEDPSVDQKEEDADQNNEEKPFVMDQGNVTLSEIKSGGTDAGDEFVELYNAEERAVSLEGWSLQYFAASETAQAQKRDLPAATIPAHGYFLVGRAFNDSGADGYRGNVDADFTHRSFGISGSGATITLVRGQEKVASTSDASVVDSVGFPKLNAGASYERAARFGNGCADPRKGAPGEFLGNACPARTWYVREAAEPQNAASLHEPRTENGFESESTTTSSEKLAWLSLPVSGYERESNEATWKLLVITRDQGEPPAEVSTKTQLQAEGMSTLRVAYEGCAGPVESPGLLVPLSPHACQAGGPLSGAYRGSFWEDGVATVRVIGNLVEGEILRIFEYAFSGGRSGDQYFSLNASSTVTVETGGKPPEAPTGLVVDADNLPFVRIEWEVARDPDTVDDTLKYEISISSGGADQWEDVGASREVNKELQPGMYTVRVRAIDERGNKGPSASIDIELREPDMDQLDHGNVLQTGSGSLRIRNSVSLSGVAVWIVPQGGPYCCSNVSFRIENEAGNIVAVAQGGRRVVDGEGEIKFDFESPITLEKGTYRLSVLPTEASNPVTLGGKSMGGDWNGLGAAYVRFVN